MKKNITLLFLLQVCCLFAVAWGESLKVEPKFEHFVVRKGDQLFEGDQPFRFLGLAAPNLQANESQFRPDFSNRFPDEYEIRDLMGALQQIGSRATRTFSLSVVDERDNGAPTYITGYRTYSEEAFQCMDRILALAHEYDVRIILPFIASQSFPTIRGVDEFALLAGKPGPAFWTDEGVKDDFKHFVSYILNRKNTVNGLLYKEDPAILAWQLGNEFGSYPYDRRMDPRPWDGIILAWSKEMAAFIKQQGAKQLVMEAGGCSREELIKDPNIDVISEHLYEYWNRMANRPWHLSPLAKEAREQCKGRKPLMIDEFGLGSYENVVELMDAIIEEDIVGGLMWSIRSHRRDGGWYYHNEGGTPVNSFHHPGFSVGFTYEAKRMLGIVREKAFKIRGMEVPPYAVPTPKPVLFPTENGFTWRGSMGAAHYTIERAESAEGPWQVMAVGLEDSVIADCAKFEPTPEALLPLTLWHDVTAKAGKTYYYRIKGSNVSGCTEWSDVLKR
jgi:hypothetical protein